MIIRRLTIRNFGKIHDRTLELSPGINVLYGENESGKTTVHTFIKSMFYGITRQRGKAAKNDIYTKYEPWENPVVYGGTLWFESAGKHFRLTRNFHKSSPSSELLCEDDGELLDVDRGDLEGVLGDISEAVYDNTVSVAQLKSVTGKDLVRELQNYMASYQGAGDSSVDLGRTMQMLKMSRKGFQVQADRRRKAAEKEQEKLAVNMEYLRSDMEELKERRSQVEAKEKSLHMRPGEEDGGELLDERIRNIRMKKGAAAAVTALAAIFCLGGAVYLEMISDRIYPGILAIVGAVASVTVGMFFQRRLTRELNKRKRLKNRWLSQQEKLKWNKESFAEAYEEKQTAYANLQAEYQAMEEEAYFPISEDVEIRALNLAMETIEKLSGNINHQVGERLRRRTSQILSEITGGKYQEVLMDQELRMTVNTKERTIPLERLSRGTLEQIYFALRMAAGELLCGKENFPVILDDVFGMYDEDRLAAVLGWLHKEKKQIIISTCNKREMQLLEREGIPYQRLIL